MVVKGKENEMTRPFVAPLWDQIYYIQKAVHFPQGNRAEWRELSTPDSEIMMGLASRIADWQRVTDVRKGSTSIYRGSPYIPETCIYQRRREVG